MEVSAYIRKVPEGYFAWTEGLPLACAYGATVEEARKNLVEGIRRAAGLGGFEEGRTSQFDLLFWQQQTEKALESGKEIIKETLSIPDL